MEDSNVGLQAMQLMSFLRRKSARSSPTRVNGRGAGITVVAATKDPVFFSREIEGYRHAVANTVARLVSI